MGVIQKVPAARVDLVCPECGALMRLRKSRFGLFYGCTRYPYCKASHGAHPDGAPLGVPVNKASPRSACCRKSKPGAARSRGQTPTAPDDDRGHNRGHPMNATESTIVNPATGRTFDGSIQVDGAYKVDTSKGEMRSDVSSQWWSRPDDQRFLNLDDLLFKVAGRREIAEVDNISPKEFKVVARPDDPDKLELTFDSPKGEQQAQMTHFSFGQVSSLVRAPAAYLRRLPAPIAGINLQYGLSGYREGPVQAYRIPNEDHVELRAATGSGYGRVWDEEVVRAVMWITGDGTGQTHHWKVPGVLNWHDGTYDPNSPITRESTTLFASDRDVFLFLVDDRRPIEIGKLPNGSPDLVYRGFYVWNSEVGSKGFALAAFYMRGVCQNRLLWGVECFQELKFRHSSGAPDRFMREAAPALESFSDANTSAFLKGVKAAKDAVVAKDDDDRSKFLKDRGFTATQSKEIIEQVTQEEGKAPESIWDFVQGITAKARSVGHQDERTAMERMAGKLLDKVA